MLSYEEQPMTDITTQWVMERLALLEAENERIRREQVEVGTEFKKSMRRMKSSAAGLLLVTGLVLSMGPGRTAIAQGYGLTLSTLAARVTALENQARTLSSTQSQHEQAIGLLNAKTAYMSTGTDRFGHAATYFRACNVFVQDGLGTTESSGNPNGLGNLIIGYDETTYGFSNNHIGSHNLILGTNNHYSSFAGIVAGNNNVISAPGASVLGGEDNSAEGLGSVIIAGSGNNSFGSDSTVLSGQDNLATGWSSAVVSGRANRTFGNDSVVAGGFTDEATGDFSSILGGSQNASLQRFSCVAGGTNNHAIGVASSVCGGQSNVAGGDYSSVTGGVSNIGAGDHSSVSGGYNNAAGNYCTSVSGGLNITNVLPFGWAGGVFHTP